MANRKDHLNMSGLDYPLSGGGQQQQQQHQQQMAAATAGPGRPPGIVVGKEHAKVIRCDVCGTITHKIERTLFGKKKIPLTIEGKSLRGICLICNGPSAPPMHNNMLQQMQLQQQGVGMGMAIPNIPGGIPEMMPATNATLGVPHELVVTHRDDATVVSAITLDHRFADPDDSDEESANFRVDPGQRRPEPSLGDPDEYERPAPLRRKRDSRVHKGSSGPLPPFQPSDHPIISSSTTRRDNYHQPQHVPSSSTAAAMPPRQPQRRETNDSHEMLSNSHNSHSPWITNTQELAAVMTSYEMQHQQQQQQQQQDNNLYNASGNVVMSSAAIQQQQQQQQQIPQTYENQIHEQHHHQQHPSHHQMMGVIPPGGPGPGPGPGGQQQQLPHPPQSRQQQHHRPTPPAFGNQHLYSSDMPPSATSSSYGQEEKEEIAEPNHHPHHSEWPQPPRRGHRPGPNGVGTGSDGIISTMNNTRNNTADGGLTGKGTYPHALSDIPDLVNRLNHSSALADQHQCANIIQSLAEAVWEYGQQAKIVVMEVNGLQGVTRSMWENMADGIEVQEAALNLIFALASSTDGEAQSDVFIGPDAQDAVDALLIVMQTHLTVENIQHTGCGTLACLAAASGNNTNVDDASLSGALITVVSAMEAHRNSKGVQVLGIRALYNQCVYSRSAESNKRSLAKAGMEEENKCGATVIYRAIEISEDDMVTMEWACRLYWCLSASEDVAEFLTVTNHPLYVILEALQRFHELKEAGGLIEAIFGALANLVKAKDNIKVVDSSILFVVVKSAKIHHQNENLLVEACALIANLVSSSTENAEAAVKADAINVIFNALKTFSSPALFEEALRTLTILCHTSDDIKRYLCTPAMLSCLAEACEINANSGAYGQEMYIQLMASLLTRKGLQHTVVARGGVDMLLSAMKAYPNDRRVQEAGCLAMRNLACHHDDLNIDFGEPVAAIMQAMAIHQSSEKVQLNGCCTLWNLASVDTKLSDTEMIHCLVKAMQMHMESAAVLEMACGALCHKIKGSQEGKELFIESGGLDAVTCVLIMHPSEPGAIEKAFCVLSCMSASSHFADEVANAQTTSNVAIAMRANSSCITLLEFGCLILRNIILLRPDHVEEASSVVATILKGMREHPDAVSYQREACCLLWSMAAMSEKCKAKILSLDGITVLLGCLEHNSTFSDVQDAALGAFNQLTPGMGT